MAKNLQLKVGAKASVTLTPSNFVASGGEGSIYKRGTTTYKVYNQPRNDFEEKVKLLSALRHPGIIAPQEPLYNKADELVGFTMPFVEGEVLVRYFSNEFRNHNSYGISQTIETVKKTREIVAAAHSQKALIVDGNEMNYIMPLGGNPCIIDVDSWQIGPYKATAIMPSIRDFHAASFTELSDWFSWAVVTFQLFVGLHPYKGKHPKFGLGSFTDRMKANVSVFNKGVLLPSTAREIKAIPANLLAWYESVFEHGKREIPPSNFESNNQPKVVQKTVYKGTEKIQFTKMREFPSEIVRVFECGVVVTKDRAYTKTSKLGLHLQTIFPVPFPKYDYHAIANQVGIFMACDSKRNEVVYLDGDNYTRMTSPMTADKFFSTDKRLFIVRDEDGLTEVEGVLVGGKHLTFPGKSWAGNSKSTFFGNGVAIYDALGTPFVILPDSSSGCLIVKEDGLKGMKVLAAKAVNNFVTCLVKDKSGQNFKIELFYVNGRANSFSKQATDEVELNFAMKSNGVVASIIDDGELQLSHPGAGQSKVVNDKHIKLDMKLCLYNDHIAFIKDNEIWSIKTA
jgi:hypothetical protein